MAMDSHKDGPDDHHMSYDGHNYGQDGHKDGNDVHQSAHDLCAGHQANQDCKTHDGYQNDREDNEDSQNNLQDGPYDYQDGWNNFRISFF